MEKKIKVLSVKPEQKPEVIETVTVICNEDGKFMGLPLNRVLYDDRNGRPYDIISGTFLVVGIRGDDFCALSEDMLRKYKEKFHEPEIFYRTKDGIMVAKGGK